VPGERYRVYATSRPTIPSGATYAGGEAVATQTGTPLDLVLQLPALTLSGRVAGATGGTVTVGDALGLLRTATTDSAGGYTVAGLVPGAYPITVRMPGRLVSTPVALDVTDNATQDLAAGPRPATYKAWFIASGAGVPHVAGAASTTDGQSMSIGPGDGGHVAVTGQRPGTYSYVANSFLGTAPAEDGPWWFTAPLGTFPLREGATTDVGPVVLHVRAK